MTWSVKMLTVLMLAFNYTETNALPDCLRLLDTVHRPWPTLDVRVRGDSECLAKLIRQENTDDRLTVQSRLAVGMVFVVWVVALNSILS